MKALSESEIIIGADRHIKKFELYKKKIHKWPNPFEKLISDLKKNTKEVLKPEIRIYTQPETLTYEASIKTKVTSDIYLTMSNISRSDFYNIKFQKKPLMIWIWFSAILISFGGFMRLTKKIL